MLGKHGLQPLLLGLSPAVDGCPAIVWVRGEIDLASSPWLRTVLAAQLSMGVDVIVDLADVTFIDASAVGVLAGAHMAAERAGVTFTLRRPSRIVAKVLDLTGLTALVGVKQSSDAAWGRQVVSIPPP